MSPAGTESGINFDLADADATRALGAAFAGAREPAIVYLQGDLGAGKTTLVRGFLRALGHRGAVKSPSFGLLEDYAFTGFDVFHLDLYRLSDPDEAAYIGLDEFTPNRDWLWVEWAENGRGWLPRADAMVSLDFRGDGRRAAVAALTDRGKRLAARCEREIV